MRKNIEMVVLTILFLAIYNFILMQLWDFGGLFDTKIHGARIFIYSLSVNVALSYISGEIVMKIINSSNIK